MIKYINILGFLIILPSVVFSQVPAPSSSTGSADNNVNWVISKTFDGSGNIINEGKQFFDEKGKLIQTQNKVKYRKNASTVYTHVFASQPLRDAYHREAATTLAAPINNSEFIYKNDFVRYGTGSTIYDYRHFDRFKPTTTETDKTNAPEAVGNTASGTLGWYYSANNTWEPYTPTTTYPYSRQSFYRDGTGNVKKNANAGETFRMGNGKEVASYVTSVTSELNDYVTIRNKYFTSAGALPTSLKGKAIQTISRDANGKEVITIQDQDGKTLMVARPGNELSVTNVVNIPAKYTFFFNGNALGAPAKNLVVKRATGHIRVYNADNVDGYYSYLYQGVASGFTSPSPLNKFYKIEAEGIFTVSYQQTLNGADVYVCQDCPANIEGQSQHLFKLTAPSVVTISNATAPVQLYNMETEQTIAFATGNTVPAGYYKMVSNALSNLNLTYTNAYSDVSYSFYNQLGQLIATIAPEGVKKLYGTGINNYATKDVVPYITLYEYDIQGRLVNTKSSDVGVGEIIYRKDGKTRFSQNAQQKIENKYSYTNYDAFGRPVETGEMQPGSSIPFNSDLTAAINPMRDILEDISSTGGLSSGTRMSVVTTLYDVSDNTHGVVGYTQDAFNLRGAVSLTRTFYMITGSPPYNLTYSHNETWYNYDEEGKLLWKVQYVHGFGRVTEDYSYNVLGQMVKKVFQKNTATNTFVHYYEYDPANLQLWKVYTNTADNPTTKMLQATYIYYLHGPLKRIELATDLQGIDYTYTLQGALKAINNNDKTKDPGGDGTTFKTDAFGMVLDYYPNDYVNSRTSGIQVIKGVNTSSLITTESYAGNIKAMSWFSKKPAAVLALDGAAENPRAYVFNYDDKYQFLESTWCSTLNFANTPATVAITTAAKEKIKHPTSGVPAYDANGNIQYLQRTDIAGNPTDNFSYNYTPNTNRLASVMQNGSTTYANYTYDQIGQLTMENTGVAANKKYLYYDAAGKVQQVARDAAFTQKVVVYDYDERGQRITKRHFNPAGQWIQTTVYVCGAIFTAPVTSGVVGTYTLQEHEIDGGTERLGTFYRPTNIYAYEMTDHLGNVRAVVAKNAGNLEVRTYSDYYPFGAVIQGLPNSYRYGYQGQYSEKEAETDWNAFELRMYDSRIARWLSVDPKGEFYSPYLAMGNDPISKIDPDGGNTNSTHTDAKGKVLAVYNDDNNGVYKHNIDASAYKGEFLSAESGTLMGETLIWNSFMDESGKARGTIDFTSFDGLVWMYKASKELKSLNRSDMDTRVLYAINATGNDRYDYKTNGLKGDASFEQRMEHIYRGSQLSKGLYLSARDFGNYFAGYIAASTHQPKLEFLKIAGALNHYKHSRTSFIMEMALGFYRSISKFPSYGEWNKSNLFQRIGYHGVQSKMDLKNLGKNLWID